MPASPAQMKIREKAAETFRFLRLNRSGFMRGVAELSVQYVVPMSLIEKFFTASYSKGYNQAVEDLSEKFNRAVAELKAYELEQDR